MEFKHYKQTDEGEIVNLWNKYLTFDNLDANKFRRQEILDDNFDEKLTWLACDCEKIVPKIDKFP